MYITKLTEKCQTTVPIELREQLGLEAGDEIVWFKEGHRLVIEAKSVKDPLLKLKKMRFDSKKTALELTQEVENEFY
ncbi:AbrB/MazE/SpoVT family DNA-binding domain-containing protein [Candidatus Micrarchaeota archaeon]|nr:AbrB/MazE/SpoVT family DNA-binding domain-containing protein [Candidatus Micrarchaeota archaeon]